MKVKEITESEITIKPLPGAQQLAIDGKPIGQANDPAVAQQIAQATKDGKLTLNDPTKPQMGSQGAGIQEEPGDDSGLIKQYTSQLQSLLPQATQPWEKAQIEARIKAVTQDGWVPKDPNGKAIAVLPPAQWEAKMDPQTVLKICGVNGPGLSPEFKQKMGGALSQGIMKYTGFEESVELTDIKKLSGL